MSTRQVHPSYPFFSLIFMCLGLFFVVLEIFQALGPPIFFILVVIMVNFHNWTLLPQGKIFFLQTQIYYTPFSSIFAAD